MSTLILTDADVRALLPMAECIELMAGALRQVTEGAAVLPLRTVLRLGDNAFASMPAIVGAAIGAKVITIFPGNDATPFDSHIGVVLLFDAEFGRLLAIADASSITAIRTAAVSGLATRLLAREEASTLALLGAGVLAMPHLEAVRAVRPIRQVRVWSRSGARAEAFAVHARAAHGVDVQVLASAEAAVDGADVVCTITASRTPIVEGRWLKPGTHVNAVGASLKTTRELDSQAVQRGRFFADRRESVMAESGDFLIPLEEGAIRESHLLGELGELVTKRIAGRTSPAEITIFKSLGLAVEDVAALRHIHERALAAGRGMKVELGGRRD
jgi:ornithine cyclodeaminase/alanine dehydrogenase-like protein (mu-crystallin family)